MRAEVCEVLQQSGGHARREYTCGRTPGGLGDRRVGRHAGRRWSTRPEAVRLRIHEPSRVSYGGECGRVSAWPGQRGSDSRWRGGRLLAGEGMSGERQVGEGTRGQSARVAEAGGQGADVHMGGQGKGVGNISRSGVVPRRDSSFGAQRGDSLLLQETKNNSISAEDHVGQIFGAPMVLLFTCCC